MIFFSFFPSLDDPWLEIVISLSVVFGVLLIILVLLLMCIYQRHKK